MVDIGVVLVAGYVEDVGVDMYDNPGVYLVVESVVSSCVVDNNVEKSVVCKVETCIVPMVGTGVELIDGVCVCSDVVLTESPVVGDTGVSKGVSVFEIGVLREGVVCNTGVEPIDGVCVCSDVDLTESPVVEDTRVTKGVSVFETGVLGEGVDCNTGIEPIDGVCVSSDVDLTESQWLGTLVLPKV